MMLASLGTSDRNILVSLISWALLLLGAASSVVGIASLIYCYLLFFSNRRTPDWLTPPMWRNSDD
jgi:hypothetical protein